MVPKNLFTPARLRGHHCCYWLFLFLLFSFVSSLFLSFFPSYDRGLLTLRSIVVSNLRHGLIRALWDTPWCCLFGLPASFRLLNLLLVLGTERMGVLVPSHWQGRWGGGIDSSSCRGGECGERVPGPQGRIPGLSETFYQDQKTWASRWGTPWC